MQKKFIRPETAFKINLLGIKGIYNALILNESQTHQRRVQLRFSNHVTNLQFHGQKEFYPTHAYG